MNYALELEKLTKTYAGGVQALRGIDLRVEAGDFYALLGPNGAGKSTTIGIISSLVNKPPVRFRYLVTTSTKISSTLSVSSGWCRRNSTSTRLKP